MTTRTRSAGATPPPAESAVGLRRRRSHWSLPDVVAQAAAIEACYVAVDRALRTEVDDAGA